MSEKLKVVGRRLPLVDAVEKVTGRASFTTDVYLPEMLYGKILRSPYAHARIVKIDTTRAEKLPGVKAVLTVNNVPRIKHSGESPPTYYREDQYILDEKVRYVGDGVAAVAAVSEDVAEEALQLIEVEYEVLPAVFDPIEAMKPDAPKIHEVAHNIAALMKIERGDVEKGFKEADYVFEDRYKTSRQQHCPLEPHACVASFDRAGKLTMWLSSQETFKNRHVLGKVLGLPLNKIRIIADYVGGGFGGKLDIYQMEPLCALLSKKTGKPVKIVLTRAEEFYASRTRHPMIIELKVGVKKDGTLTTVQGRVIANTGAYVSHGAGVTGTCSRYLVELYRWPNVKVEGYCVYTNAPIAGAYRGYGNPQASFAREQMIDTIAEKLGIDPLVFRLKNMKQIGDMYSYSDKFLDGLPITSCGLEECVRRGAEAIGWNRRNKKSEEASSVLKRGIGMACMVHATSAFAWHSELGAAFLKLNEDGTAHLLTGCSDVGQGLKTTLAQIVAEDLGLRLEDVSVTVADTEITPVDEGAHASRSMYVVGNAVRAAAADAKRQLLERASKMLEVAVENLECGDRRVYVKGSPEKAVSISDVVMNAQFTFPATSIMGRGSYQPLDQPPAFAAQFAEVEVDTEACQVKVLKMVAAHDVGRAINPMIVEGQLEGSIQQGVGYALTEDLLIDDNGKPRNASFLDYKILAATDMPKTEIIIVEPVDPVGPYGAKGVGEPGLVATAPAVANAIYNATGVRLKELPMSRERILKALKPS